MQNFFAGCVCLYSGLTSLSTIFQSYHDGCRVYEVKSMILSESHSLRDYGLCPLRMRNPYSLILGAYFYLGRVKRIWYFRAVSPEPPLLLISAVRGTFIQKARSLAPLNGWACAVKICYDGMLEDTNSLDASHLLSNFPSFCCIF